MGKIIAAFSHKGGVGKTNFIFNLGHSLADKGASVLFIDIDAQMNLTSSVLGKSDTISYSNTEDDDALEQAQVRNNEEWATFLATTQNFMDYVNTYINQGTNNKPLYQPKGHSNISLLASSLDLPFLELTWADIVLGSRTEKQITDLRLYYFQQAIIELAKKYDYVLIDTPPSSSSVITGLSVITSNYFFVPVTPGFFALQAINNLKDILEYWQGIFSKHEKTGNRLGLSFHTKLLGVVMQKSRPYNREGKRNQYSKNTEIWKNKINETLKETLFSTGRIPIANRLIGEDEFKHIFPESDPFVVDMISDFTLGLSTEAEKRGKPVIHLTEKDLPTLQADPTKPANQQHNHIRTLASIKQSYNYIADCLLKNLK
jgi:chromosome partitioning protein